jgi:hypothetical protein
MATPIKDTSDLTRELEAVIDEFGGGISDTELDVEEELGFTESEDGRTGDSEKERVSIPLRLLPTQMSTKARGRKLVSKLPVLRDSDYHLRASAAKSKFVDEDRVVTAARNRAESAQILHLIKEQIACEAAAIHFQRIENEKNGKDTAQTSSRRISALTNIAHIELEIKKLGADLIDLRGERFQKVFKLWIEIIRGVAAETLPPEQIDLFFNRLSTAMEGWEDTATDNAR